MLIAKASVLPLRNSEPRIPRNQKAISPPVLLLQQAQKDTFKKTLPSLKLGGRREDFFNAVKDGNAGKALHIIQNDPNPDVFRDQEANTGLLKAAYYGKVDVAEALLAANADLEAVNCYGNKAWMIAAQEGHLSTLSLFLNKLKQSPRFAEQLNAINLSGNTALMIAAEAGEDKAVQLLLQYGANPEIQNHSGQTAYALAHDNSFNTVCQILQRERARQQTRQQPSFVVHAPLAQDIRVSDAALEPTVLDFYTTGRLLTEESPNYTALLGDAHVTRLVQHIKDEIRYPRIHETLQQRKRRIATAIDHQYIATQNGQIRNFWNKVAIEVFAKTIPELVTQYGIRGNSNQQVPRELMEAINSAKKRSYYLTQFSQLFPTLGRGMECVVYKVTDNYVVRVPIKGEYRAHKISHEKDIVPIPDNIPELDGIDNIAKPVAYFFSKAPSGDTYPVYFHKLMPGKKASINTNELLLGGEIPPGKNARFDSVYSQYLDKISRFSIDSYKQLLWSVHQLDKAGYAIDPGSNNLIVGNNQFSIVDYSDKEVSAKVGINPEGEENNLAYVMSMLLDIQYKSRLRPFGYVVTEKEQNACREILRKLFTAAAEIQHSNRASIKLPSAVFYERHQYDSCWNSFTPEEVFRACDIDESRWILLRDALRAQRPGNAQDRENVHTVIKSILI